MNGDTLRRKVLIERLKKMSYLTKQEQKLFPSIDVKAEFISLSSFGPMQGCYFDSEYLIAIEEYNGI